MYKLEKDEFKSIKKFTKNITGHLVIKAIIDGIVTANIWVDNKININNIFIFDIMEEKIFLFGNADNEEFINSLKILISRCINWSKKNKYSGLVFETFSEKWKKN